MKSNSFFSFRRLYLLTRNDILLNYKKYLLTIVGAFIVGSIIIYLQMPTREYSNHFDIWNYTMTFMICLVGLGAFIGISFPAFSSKTSTMSYLLLPSSTLEKFLSQFLIRIVISTGLFFLIFWIDAYFAREAATLVLQKYGNTFEIEPFDYSNLFYNLTGERYLFVRIVITMTFISIGFFLYSIRIYFNRLALVKTAISLVTFLSLGVLLFAIFSHIFYPETKGMDFKLNIHQVFKQVTNIEFWLFTMFCLSILILIPLGYFKLKEKQL